MKKLALTALTVLSCGMAFALPVGNPTDASLYTNGIWCGRSNVEPCDPCFSWFDAFSVRLGFYGDYVFNRNMQFNSGEQKHIEQFELYTNAGLLVVNVCDWVDVFATFGATNIYAATADGAFTQRAIGTSRQVLFTWQPKFSWSVGGRATLWECDCFGIGVEGQYFQTTPNLGNVFSTLGDVYLDSQGSGSRYGEWQVGIGASYTFTVNCPGTTFVPYMGLKWAGCTFNTSNSFAIGGATFNVPDLENQKLWGYCVGFTATQNEVMGVTVEGRFADEKAVYVNGQIRF